MRTFTRDDIDEARAAWDDGGFSSEWRAIRHKAVMGGLIYPPSGDAYDSWDDDSPSQRAILIRAIRETPKLLDQCVVGASSWYVVIQRLTTRLNEWGDELRAKERDAEREKAAENPSHRDAVSSLGAIIGRIEASR